MPSTTLEMNRRINRMMPMGVTGKIVRTEGMMVAVRGLPVPVGALVRIHRQADEPMLGEVIGFKGDETLVYPFEETHGIRPGNDVQLHRTCQTIGVGPQLLGRVLDARGRAIDHGAAMNLSDQVMLHRAPPNSIDRPRIDEVLSTGIRSIDGMLSCGVGQRVGIFAGSGVGKSVLMGMMARYTSADVNVIGLVGERGREVNDFIERDLGPEGLVRSVVVVATGDQPALFRVQAAQTATAIAEYFRDAGKNVMLMMDSLTRFAMAQREIGLAAGEPPTTRGYPPSVFSMLPRLVERAGRTKQGSITGFYTVLVEGDDSNEPVSDTVRGLLDGHVMLNRKLAAKGHYPAIDVLSSISRLMNELSTPEQLQAARRLRELMSIYKENEDLITIGAYRQGSNMAVDTAINAQAEINAFLQQAISQRCDANTAKSHLMQLAAKYRGAPVAQQPVRPQQ